MRQQYQVEHAQVNKTDILLVLTKFCTMEEGKTYNKTLEQYQHMEEAGKGCRCTGGPSMTFEV